MTSGSEDQLLIQQLKKGNGIAYEQLFLKFYDGLVDYAAKYLKDNDLAEEIVQELFARIWEKRATLEITSSVSSYLFRAVRNGCLNHFKHQKVKQQFEAHGKRERTLEESAFSDVLEELELAQKIEEAIAQLPDARKRIFQMSRHEGLKYREIADKLDLSIKTVESQMTKALTFLRSQLKEYLE